MGELKLNEERAKVAKEFRDTVTNLIQKYTYIEEAFKVTVSNIQAMQKASNEESIKELGERTEQLELEAFFLKSKLEGMERVNIYSNGRIPVFSDTIEMYSRISEVAFELGKLEGLSLEQISTNNDLEALRESYEKLRKILMTINACGDNEG